MMYKQLTSEQRYVISAIRHTLNDKRQPVNSECVNHGDIVAYLRHAMYRNLNYLLPSYCP
jgi:hypothetical protein